MKIRKATDSSSPGSHGRLAPGAHIGLSFWVSIALASMALGVICIAALPRSQSAETSAHPMRKPPPYWAYAIDPPAGPSTDGTPPADKTPRHVPGSPAAFTLTQIADFFFAPDWHPQGHPVMPGVVAHGRTPDVFACGYCHLPNGQGRPENSSLAGLPAGYIIQQVADFKNALRTSSNPKRLPVALMIAVARDANEIELRAAADYFSSLKPIPWIRVVETKSVPKMQVSGWMMVPSDAGGTELLGRRIMETPENLEQTELRNDASGFIAYVPFGSINKGRTLVTTGGAGKTIQCATCHGPDLKGVGNVPSIAGRSPSYVVRQLYDIQSGDRAGATAQLMKPIVTALTLDDMISIAAYTASLNP